MSYKNRNDYQSKNRNPHEYGYPNGYADQLPLAKRLSLYSGPNMNLEMHQHRMPYQIDFRDDPNKYPMIDDINYKNISYELLKQNQPSTFEARYKSSLQKLYDTYSVEINDKLDLKNIKFRYMDKNNFVKLLSNYEIHCEKVFPIREEVWKHMKKHGDIYSMDDSVDKSIEMEKNNSTPMTDKEHKAKLSIVKERQELNIKNRDFLLTLYKKYVQIQDDEESHLEFYQIRQGKKRKYLSYGLIFSYFVRLIEEVFFNFKNDVNTKSKLLSYLQKLGNNLKYKNSLYSKNYNKTDIDRYVEKRQEKLKDVVDLDKLDYTPHYLHKPKRFVYNEEDTRQRMDEFKLNKYIEKEKCNMDRNRSSQQQPTHTPSLSRSKTERDYVTMARLKREKNDRKYNNLNYVKGLYQGEEINRINEKYNMDKNYEQRMIKKPDDYKKQGSNRIYDQNYIVRMDQINSFNDYDDILDKIE